MITETLIDEVTKATAKELFEVVSFNWDEKKSVELIELLVSEELERQLMDVHEGQLAFRFEE